MGLTDLFEKSSATGFASQMLVAEEDPRKIGQNLRQAMDAQSAYQEKGAEGTEFGGMTTGLKTADDARS